MRIILVRGVFVLFLPTATVRNSASFRRIFIDRAGTAVKVHVFLPIVGSVHAAAFQPLFLNPIDEILQVGILAIVDDHVGKLVFGLIFHPILVQEQQYARGQLQKQNHAHAAKYKGSVITVSL